MSSSSSSSTNSTATTNPLGDDKYALASRIELVLKNAPTNKAAKEALLLVATTYGMRLVPMGVPVGTPQTKQQTPIQQQPAKPKGITPQQGKSSWKLLPKYQELEKQRSTIVEQLKHCVDTTQKSVLTNSLRTVEADMKIFRTSLGAGPPKSSNPVTQKVIEEKVSPVTGQIIAPPTAAAQAAASSSGMSIDKPTYSTRAQAGVKRAAGTDLSKDVVDSSKQ